MSRDLTVVVLVEGQTEHGFVKEVLAPYWGQRGIFVQAPIYFFPPCFMFRRVPLRRCWKKVAVPRP